MLSKGLQRCEAHQGVTSPVSAANNTVSIKKARCLWGISRDRCVSSLSSSLRHTMMAGDDGGQASRGMQLLEGP